VGTAKFGGPVRPGAFIVKDRAIFKATSEIAGNQRESRSFGEGGSQKVLVNHGPSVEMVQKASGRNFTAVSVRNMARRNTGPTPTKHAVAETHGQHDKDGTPGGGPDHNDNSGNGGFKSGPDRDPGGGRGGRGGGGHGKGH
jgi:hypothetical protein